MGPLAGSDADGRSRARAAHSRRNQNQADKQICLVIQIACWHETLRSDMSRPTFNDDRFIKSGLSAPRAAHSIAG